MALLIDLETTVRIAVALLIDRETIVRSDSACLRQRTASSTTAAQKTFPPEQLVIFSSVPSVLVEELVDPPDVPEVLSVAHIRPRTGLYTI